MQIETNLHIERKERWECNNSGNLGVYVCTSVERKMMQKMEKGIERFFSNILLVMFGPGNNINNTAYEIFKASHN